MIYNDATAQRLVDLSTELERRTTRLSALRTELEREAAAAPSRLRAALMGFADGGDAPDVSGLTFASKAAADAIAAIDVLAADLASKFEGRRLHLQREHNAAEAKMADIEARRAMVLLDGELRIGELDTYLRIAALAGPLPLADAMAYMESLGHGRVAQQRLDALVAGGHVAADALVSTGWAA